MSPENETLHEVQQEIDKLESRWSENPKGRVFAHLADAYRRLGEFSKAENLILHGLKNHPNYISAYIVLGRIYVDSERYSDAHTQLTKVLELDPQNLIALQFLGDLAMRGGRFEDARSWYERIIQIDPRNEEASNALATLDGGGPELAAEPTAAAAEPKEAGLAMPEPVSTVEEATPAAPLAQDSEPASDDADLGATDESPAEVASSEREFDPEATPWERILQPDDLPASMEQTLPEHQAGDSDEAEAATVPDADSIDLGNMENWTPGFLRDEDLGAAEHAPDEMFRELETDDIDLSGAAIDEAGLVTETMAELYAEQGLFEDALRVYRQLLEVRPNDDRLRDKVREIEARQSDDEAISAAQVEEGVEEDVADFEPVAGGFMDVVPDELAPEPDAGLAYRGMPADWGLADDSTEAIEPAAPAAQSGEGGFEFEKKPESPEVVSSDSFAGSFAASSNQRDGPSLFAAEVAEPKPEPVAVEAASVAGENIAARVSDVAPEPVTSQDESETIESYLTGLLAIETGAAPADETSEPQAASPGGGAAAAGAQSDDLAEFQEWLKGLKR